jgi:hypothetical protein
MSSLVLVLAAVAAGAPPANASSAGFCRVARGVARDLVASTSFSTAASAHASVRTTYLRIEAAEPSLLATAPAPVKANLRPVLGLVNVIVADFEKVNWSTAGFARYVPALVPRAQAVARPMKALRGYLRTTCKLDV